MSESTRVPEIEAPAAPGDVLDTAAAGGLVIRGSIVRVLGFGAGTVLSVLSAALLTRHLGPARFGEYVTVVSVVSVAGTITDAGITGLTTQEYASRSGLDRERVMRNLLGMRVAIVCVALMLALGFAFAAGYDTTRVVGTAVTGIALGLVSIQGTIAVPLTAMLRLGRVTALELMRQTVTVALTVLLIALGAGLLPLLAALVPASLLAVVLTAILVRGQMPLRPSVDLPFWATQLRATVTFSLATGVGAAYVFATQIITSLAASAHQNGLFAASFRVFAVVASSAGLVVGSAFPLLVRAARDDAERLAYAVSRLFQVSAILGLAAAVASVTGAQTIIAVVAGPRYAAAAGVLQIEAAALVASFMLATTGYALISLRQYRALVLCNLLALGVTTVLTLVLARSHGAKGSAIASVCGEWILSIGYLVALVRGGRVGLAWGSGAKVLLAAAPAFAVMLLGLPNLLQLLLALAVYGGGILAARAIPPELLPSWRRT